MDPLLKNVINDSFGWDVANWSRSIPFWEKHLGDIKGKYALELGNGGKFGGLALWLAYKGANVVCSDYKGVRDEAKAVHAKYAFAKNITYKVIDATAIPHENEFDIVACKSMLGGIIFDKDLAIGKQVFEQIHKALKTNGSFICCENGYATSMHQWLRNRYGAGRVKWRYFTLNDFEFLTNKFGTSKIASFGFLGCFTRKEAFRKILAKVDNLFDTVIPIKSKYILAAYLEKTIDSRDTDISL